jgi:lactose/L-arabinose transport system ATP-binding protein
MNFLAGKVAGNGVEVPALKTVVPVSARLPAVGTPVLVGLRPEHLSVAPGDGLSLDMTEALGGVSYAYLTAPTGERLIVEERGDTRSSPGGRADVSFEPGRAYLFDAKTEARIR